MTSAASEQIYCLKCRTRTDTLETQEVVLKNGVPRSLAPAPSAGPRSSAWARPGSSRREREGLEYCCSL